MPSVPTPPTPRPAGREQARLARKKALCAQQVLQFEDELSVHELNVARLTAAGQPTTDAEAAIVTILQAIATTEAEKITAPTQ